MAIKIIVAMNQPCQTIETASAEKPFIELETGDAEHAYKAAAGLLKAYPEVSVTIIPDNGDPPEYLMREAQSFPV